MNNRIQEIMDLEHFKTLTPIQEQVLNRKIKIEILLVFQVRVQESLTLSLCPSLKN